MRKSKKEDFVAPFSEGQENSVVNIELQEAQGISAALVGATDTNDSTVLKIPTNDIGVTSKKRQYKARNQKRETVLDGSVQSQPNATAAAPIVVTP